MQENIAIRVIEALKAERSNEDAAGKQRFFKTGPGEYGEGDLFWGISVPKQRDIARQYKKHIRLQDIQDLIIHPVHEVRLTALFLLVQLFEAGRKEAGLQQACVALYLDHLDHVNNWDLVDSSAHKILGAWLRDKDRHILYQLASSAQLWRQRVAIIATLDFIQHQDYNDTLQLAALLLQHPRDLIHKAVGWMLREIGKRDMAREEAFLLQHYRYMPRTMLRYAIEHMPPSRREAYLKGRL